MSDSSVKAMRAKRLPMAILLGAAAPVGLCLSSRYSYLPFHACAEMFSVAVACSIFVLL